MLRGRYTPINYQSLADSLEPLIDHNALLNYDAKEHVIAGAVYHSSASPDVPAIECQIDGDVEINNGDLTLGSNLYIADDNYVYFGDDLDANIHWSTPTGRFVLGTGQVRIENGLDMFSSAITNVTTLSASGLISSGSGSMGTLTASSLTITSLTSNGYLKTSGGVGTVVESTTIPIGDLTGITQDNMLYASATNTISQTSNLTWNESLLGVTGAITASGDIQGLDGYFTGTVGIGTTPLETTGLIVEGGSDGGITLNQNADSVGFKVVGHDDKNTVNMTFNVNSDGSCLFDANGTPTNMLFTNKTTNGGMFFRPNGNGRTTFNDTTTGAVAMCAGGGPAYIASRLNIGSAAFPGASLDLTVQGPVEFYDTLDVTGVTTLGGNVDLSAADIITDTTTGTKIGTGTTQKIGFYNTTPVVQASAYTQTYSTTDKTHAARTAPGAGAGSGADATTFSGAECDALVADQQDTAQLLNSLIDDLQALGLIA